MVEERQRQRQTPLARIENPGSNAMDNYYGFDRGLDVKNPQDLRRQQDAQAMKNPHHPIHANRTDYMAQGYNSLGQLQNYPSRRNMRGKDRYRVNVGPRPEGDTTGLGGLINRLDTGNKGYGYMLNRVFELPFDQEVIDWQDKYGSDYSSYTGDHRTESHISSERQPGLEGNMGLRPLQQMANTNNPESNFRILQQMSPTQQEEYQTADASNVFDIYNQYKDKYGEFDFGDMEYSNSYEKELGPGILGFDGSYDFDDNDAKMGINYSMSFDDGGIATLPETQSMQQPKVPMTDEQKDYLYDYMLDFMIKQRMKEQKEMEGKIPPFNYEGLEV